MQIIDNTVCDIAATARRIEGAPAYYRSLVGGEEARFAVIRGAQRVEQVEAYLPDNYALVESFREELVGKNHTGLVVIIGGVDRAGWTLDDYVIPRLASGLIWASEIS